MNWCIWLSIPICSSLSLASPGSQCIERAIEQSWGEGKVRAEWQSRTASRTNWEISEDWTIVDKVQACARGPQTYSLMRKAANGSSETVKVNGIAKVFARVPTPSRTIASGSGIQPEAFTDAELEITNQQSPILSLETFTTPHIAARTLVPGRPLSAHDLIPAPIVRAGQQVRMLLAVGDVRITMMGRSLSNGSEGETIRVIQEDTRKVYSAIIRNEGQIEIVF